MGDLICVACGGVVSAQAQVCDRCGNELVAGQVVFRPIALAPQPQEPQPVEKSGKCANPACKRPAMPRSKVCRECFVESARGRSFLLLAPWAKVIEVPDGKSIGLGRDPQFSAFAPQLAPCATVSRRHLLVWSFGGTLMARDLASSNGTLRNCEPMPGQADIELRPGDCLTLGGEVTFVVSPN